jgi:hypothetical protein
MRRQIAAIRLANALAKHHRVFLCNAKPELVDPAVAAAVAPDVMFLERTLGMTPWAIERRPLEHHHNRVAEGDRRIAVMGELNSDTGRCPGIRRPTGPHGRRSR